VVGVTPLDEFGIIQHLAKRVKNANRYVQVGIGDDAAVVTQQVDEDQLVTTDTMVQGVHFLPQTMKWSDVGYKCVAASVSDIAAMGGDPRHVLLAIAIPAQVPLQDLEALYDGVGDACGQYDCSLIGGDVVRTDGPLVVTSTVLGAVQRGQAILRTGAKAGDVVFVTGSVGGSAAGLEYLLEHVSVFPDDALQLLTFHQHPVAQVVAGGILREEHASSCNDISDGLASELNEIAEASGVRLRIAVDRIPIAPATRNLARIRGKDPLAYAWYGGEDYQLVGTAPPYAFARALARCQSVAIGLTQIGRVEPGDGVIAEQADGRVEQILARGFNHFASSTGGS
jgi:thiamine-monophosphate kinase